MDHIPSFEITTYDFAAKHYSDWIFPYDYHYLYILENGKDAYIGETNDMLAPGAHSQFGSGKNTQFEPEQRANPFENVFSKTAVFPPPAIAETDL